MPSSSSHRSSFSERPRSRAARLAEVVRRVVADLLEAGEQREHQPAAGRPRRRARSAPSTRARAPRRARPARGSARSRWSVSVLAGSSGAMPGSDLRRRSRNGSTSWANRRATAGSTPLSIGAAQTLRKALREPSSPGVAQSRIAQSSVRLFSTGVPVSATRHRDAMVRRLRAVEEVAFLMCCASSATTRSQARPRQRPVGRGASCRRSSARTRRRRRRGRATAPWKRRTATPGANRWISASQLPIRLAGQTTSVGPAAEPRSRRCRCRAIRVIVLPRPMSSARQAPSPAPVSSASQVRPCRW